MRVRSTLVAAAAGAVLAFSVGAAKADDYRVRGDWGGIYIGGSVGGAWSDIDVTNAAGFHFYTPGKVYGFSDDGWIAGGHVGVQHQFSHWVIGAEASLSSLDVNDTIRSTGPFATNTYSTEIETLATATARLGYAWDKWLGYVRGGYAAAAIKTSATERPSFAHDGSSREWHNGWTVGAGLEYAIRPDVIFGVEYNYVDLQAKTHVGLDSIGFSTYSVRVDPDALQTITARLSFKLGRQESEPLK